MRAKVSFASPTAVTRDRIRPAQDPINACENTSGNGPGFETNKQGPIFDLRQFFYHRAHTAGNGGCDNECARKHPHLSPR